MDAVKMVTDPHVQAIFVLWLYSTTINLLVQNLCCYLDRKTERRDQSTVKRARSTQLVKREWGANNKNIKDRLCKYLEETTPAYALLLRGSWGCGKTFLVKSFKDEENGKIGNVWYISLFGVRSLDEINDKIFEAAYPVFSAEKTQGMLSVGYSILKTVSKYKLDIDIGDLGIKVKKLFRQNGENLSCRLLIVDDIERSDISIKELFGYFSMLLGDGVRIVLVADEDRIADLDRQYYYDYKEKIIGETYEVLPEYNAAIQMVLNNLEGCCNKELEKLIFSIITILKYRNLRVIQQILLQWMVLFKNLDEVYRKDVETLRELFESYLVLQIQYKQNILKVEDPGVFMEECQEAWIAYKGYESPLTEYRKNLKKQEEKKSSYRMNTILYQLPILESWYELLILGKMIDVEWMNQQVDRIYQKKKIRREREESQQVPLYQMSRLVMNQDSRDEAHNKALFEKLNAEFSEGKYTYVDDIMEYIRLCIKLIEDEALPKEYSYKWLGDILKKFIEEHGERIVFRDLKDEFVQKVNPIEDNRLQRIIDRIFKLALEKNEQKRMMDFSNKEDFFRLIEVPDNAINSHMSKPFLNQLNLPTLFTWLESDTTMKRHKELLTFLEYRYGKGIANMTLSIVDHEDLKPVEELTKLYEREIDKQKHNYSVVIGAYKTLLDKYKDLLLYMKKCKAEKSEEKEKLN